MERTVLNVSREIKMFQCFNAPAAARPKDIGGAAAADAPKLWNEMYSPPPSLLPSTVGEACIQNTIEFRLMEGGMLVDVNYNFRNTKVCMDFDPQLLCT